MKPKQIQHAVWPMPVPTGCTALWDQSDWNHAAEMCRPSDYHGGMFDADAWRKYTRHCAEQFLRREYAAYGFDAIANHMRATRRC